VCRTITFVLNYEIQKRNLAAAANDVVHEARLQDDFGMQGREIDRPKRWSEWEIAS
jgi:hypothetical protein